MKCLLAGVHQGLNKGSEVLRAHGRGDAAQRFANDPAQIEFIFAVLYVGVRSDQQHDARKVWLEGSLRGCSGAPNRRRHSSLDLEIRMTQQSIQSRYELRDVLGRFTLLHARNDPVQSTTGRLDDIELTVGVNIATGLLRCVVKCSSTLR